MNSKKLIGWAFWLVGILWPMSAGLLETEHVGFHDDGSYNNTKTLWSFVGFVACMFAGYIFYDAGSSKLTEDGGGHGH